MKDEKILLNISKVEIAESETNEIYMMLTIPICGSFTNANGLRFTEEFLEWAVNNQEQSGLADMPICVNRDKLESGQYHNLTHEYDAQSGEFKTDMVGSVVKAWTERADDGELVLMSNAKIFKRFPKTVEAMKKLHSADKLAFSMEILGKDVRTAEKSRDLYDGVFIGHTSVSNPAYERTFDNEILVAQAYAEDLENIQQKNQQGGKVMFEVAGMSIDLMRSKLSQALDYSQYEVTFSMDNESLIIRDYEEGKFYRASFSVEGEDVKVAEKEEWVEVSLVWKDKDATDENEIRMAELESELEKANAEIEALKAEKEEPKEIDSKETELAEKLGKMVDKVEKLQAKVDELEPYRAELEAKKEAEKLQAEIEKKEACKLLASKHFDIETNVEIAEMIEKMDVNGIKIAIAEKVIQEDDEDKDAPEVIETAESKSYSPSKIELY